MRVKMINESILTFDNGLRIKASDIFACQLVGDSKILIYGQGCRITLYAGKTLLKEIYTLLGWMENDSS